MNNYIQIFFTLDCYFTVQVYKICSIIFCTIRKSRSKISVKLVIPTGTGITKKIPITSPGSPSLGSEGLSLYVAEPRQQGCPLDRHPWLIEIDSMPMSSSGAWPNGDSPGNKRRFRIPVKWERIVQ